MAVRYTITVDEVASFLPAGSTLLLAVVKTNLPAGAIVVDTGANALHIGDGKVDIGPGGSLSMELLQTDAVDTNVSGWSYWLELTYRTHDGAREQRIGTKLGPFPVTADGPLAALSGHFDTPAVAPSWRDGFRTEMEGLEAQAAAQAAAAEVARQAAEDLIVSDLGTTDGQTRALIEATGSQTHAALNNAIVGALAADPTVVDAASAAVGAAIYTERTSKNLYNPADADVLVDQVPNLSFGQQGTHVTLAGYTTSGFMPVTVGDSYAMSKTRYYEWYDAAKVSLGLATNTGAVDADPVVVAPANAAFLRSTFQHATYPNHQTEKGATQTAYEPYYSGTRLDIDPQFAHAVGAAITPYSGALNVTKAGTAVTIETDLAGTALALGLNLGGSNNGSFTMTTATFGGAPITTPNDDIAPIRTQFGAIGAGHGYANVATFANPDGKNAADLGSVWTDTAGREYVLLAIDGAGKPVVGGDFTSPSGVVTSPAVAPATNLTHVSGATHTAPMVFGTRAAAQLFPSIGRKSVRLLLDGAEAADGERRARTVEVVESYEILDYAAIYTAAKDNVGVSFSTLDLPGCVRITNRYRWTGVVCRISTTLTELLPTTITGAVGAPLQAVVHSKAGATTKHYLPGVGTVAGFDWEAGVDMTAYSTDVTIPATGLTGSQPPAFGMDVLSAGGAPVLGFAMGYLPFGVRGDESSVNSRRLTNATAGLWRVASFKKSYPAWTLSESAGWGRLTVEGFRAYLTPAEVGAVLAAKGDALTAWDALGIA